MYLAVFCALYCVIYHAVYCTAYHMIYYADSIIPILLYTPFYQFPHADSIDQLPFYLIYNTIANALTRSHNL